MFTSKPPWDLKLATLVSKTGLLTMKLPLEITNNIEVELMKDVADVVTSKIVSCQNEEDIDSFFVCDLGDIVQKYQLWLELLPRVKPFFDVSCNRDAAVLSVLSQLGVGFNCSSKGDVKLVLDHGISASRLIYSSPCKLTSHVKYTASHGVEVIVFESESELHKIKSFHPNSRLLLKLLPDVMTSAQSVNFGCHMNNVSSLLSVAKQLDMDVIGVSIQTRNSTVDTENIARTVAFAHSIFEMASRVGFNMTLLDIGESIRKVPAADVSLKDSCSMIQMILDDYFPDGCGVTIIAEAGRFFVESAFTLVTRVIDKTVFAGDLDDTSMTAFNDACIDPPAAATPDIIYCLSDGIFRSFSGILYDGLAVKPALIDHERFAGLPQHVSRLLGPSGDSLDCIISSCYLPELFVGDQILFHNMGAYALSGSTIRADDDEADGPKCYYTMHAEDWIRLCCCSTVADVSSSLGVSLSVGAEPLYEWLDI